MEGAEESALALCWLCVPGPATAGRPQPDTPHTDAGENRETKMYIFSSEANYYFHMVSNPHFE